MSSALFVGPDSHPDKYRLVRSVGRGGEATLYLAEVTLAGQTEPVVVKVLNSDVAVNEEQFRDLSSRWNDQAELLRFINRLGVVGVREHFEGVPEHRSGESAEYTDRSLFLVMNYVEGIDLRDWRAEHAVDGPKGQREVLRHLEQIAEVLDWLHSGRATPSKRAVVHGDLSPGNIMISDEGQATLVDFGLSRIATRHMTAKPWFTPGYAAPEVFNGEYSAATDRYAFGAIVYFVLAGEEPPPAPEQLRERFAALPAVEAAGPQQRDRITSMFSAEATDRPSAFDWITTLRSVSTSVPWSAPVSNPGAAGAAAGAAAAGAAGADAAMVSGPAAEPGEPEPSGPAAAEQAPAEDAGGAVESALPQGPPSGPPPAEQPPSAATPPQGGPPQGPRITGPNAGPPTGPNAGPPTGPNAAPPAGPPTGPNHGSFAAPPPTAPQQSFGVGPQRPVGGMRGARPQQPPPQPPQPAFGGGAPHLGAGAPGGPAGAAPTAPMGAVPGGERPAKRKKSRAPALIGMTLLIVLCLAGGAGGMYWLLGGTQQAPANEPESAQSPDSPEQASPPAGSEPESAPPSPSPSAGASGGGEAAIGVVLETDNSSGGAKIQSQNSGDAGDSPPITPGGPADEAGLRPGDLIVEFDSEEVRNSDHLILLVNEKKPGDRVELTYRGPDGAEADVTVTLGAKSDQSGQ
ncbi:serine/threonine protein kinase [Murinocardiopsis flavida]|uniref:non-specific serine/threonine protein kinase n=1 Tax=Murinocardiopsis flavida TaxID=645275 RepID=A0A2P8DSM4_9ACTN|nr:protein kinase [Murinocardiopsis flavida]PSL00212.1 serine/threonine protein kinase [Murinocardiopsis flavida]